MKSIPLIRAANVYPTAELLMEHGAPVDLLIKQVGLPSIVREPSDEFVPALGVWRLFELAAKRFGVMDVGAQSARRMDRSTLGSFVSAMSQAQTMHCALKTLCREVIHESTHARFWVVRDGQDSWLCRYPSLFEQGRSQAEVFVCVFFVRLLRELLGACWRPARIRLAAACEAEIEGIEELEGAEVEFDACFTAIAVPASGVPRAQDPGFACAGDDVSTRRSAPTVPLQALRTLLRSYLRDAYPSIDLAAEATGMSTRTLQRRLAQQGLSYSELVDGARFDLAAELLTDSRVKITDVAYELGFKDPGSFSRTFKRLSGLTPREYRRDCAEPTSTTL
jgi:AraC-like DNA-binding protein